MADKRISCLSIDCPERDGRSLCRHDPASQVYTDVTDGSIDTDKWELDPGKANSETPNVCEACE